MLAAQCIKFCLHPQKKKEKETGGGKTGRARFVVILSSTEHSANIMANYSMTL